MFKNLINNDKFTAKFYADIMPFVYNIGAAIVICGAMFKLLNLPGGSIMLGLGLSTEACIFILSAFEPKEKVVDWSRVYPELASHANPSPLGRPPVRATPTEKFDQCLEQASIDVNLLENLAANMRRFSENISNVPSFAKVGQITEAYVGQVGQATQELTHTLTSMNSLYKKALSDMEAQTTQTTALHKHLDTVLQAMEIASNQAVSFKEELTLLNAKVSALGEIYGKTLTAFKS